ncbi:MAG: HAD-IA family hydrolase [Planctomycetes bacterium]|nr:HAD-IA family hydrolase [Planctomycetota bacterium]
MPPVRLLLFDLDGTLADTGRDLAASANHAVAQVAGLPPRPVEEVTGFIGDGARMLVVRCLGPAHEHRIGEALPLFLEHYDRHLLDTTALYPGVMPMLEALAATPKAVLTNKPEGMSRRILDALGIAPHFRAVIGGDSLPEKKPDPSGALLLCRDLGVPPAEALLIGDSATDVRTGKAAGIRTVGVMGGFGTFESMREAGVDHVISDIEGLVPLVDSLG